MSIPKKEGKKPVYENGFKVALAKEYLTSPLGYGKLAVKYGLPGASTVRTIVAWYLKKYPQGAEASDIAEEHSVKKGKDKALTEANLKVTALELMIEIASKELGVDLVKKFGTKQSKK